MVTLNQNEIFYLNLFNVSNKTIGSTLRTLFEITDSTGRKDGIEVSPKNAEMINALMSDCNINAFFKFDEENFSGLLVMINTLEHSRTIESMTLSFESADVPVRNLEIGYNTFKSVDLARKATINEFEKLFVNTLLFKRNESVYEVSPMTSDLQAEGPAGLNAGYTDEDIRAMIMADIKVLKCFAKTEKNEENIRLLEEMKNGSRPSDYGSLLAIEQQIAGLIEDALLDVRRYRASLLSYDKKGK